MAKKQLPTNFKDDVLNSQMVGKRRYNLIQNEDGTISLEDVTNYSQIGSNFGAAQMNATNLAVNESFDKNKVIDSLADISANEAAGYAAGALAVRELNGKIENFEVDTMEELTKSYGFTVLFKQIGALKIIRIAGNPNGQLTTHKISFPEKARARYYYSTPTRVGSKWGEVQINGTSCSIKMDTPIDASAYVNIWCVYI